MERPSPTPNAFPGRLRKPTGLALVILLFFFLTVMLYTQSYTTYVVRSGTSSSYTFYRKNTYETKTKNQSFSQGGISKKKVEKQGIKNSAGIHTVALLFLSKGALHNEPVWRAFFEVAGRLSFRFDPPYIQSSSFVQKETFAKMNAKPTRRLKKKHQARPKSCPSEQKQLAKELRRLLSGEGRKRIIARQRLFTVYTHPSPGYRFPKDSIFFGTEISNRTSDKKFGMMTAELRLLEAALMDQHNRDFVLLSEWCIPLYRPELIYAQLMSETKSRTGGCSPLHPQNRMAKWRAEMETEYLKIKHWRWTLQWFSLKRSHAETVTSDRHVRQKFLKYCNGKGRRCLPEEHYIPTVLAVYGLEDETDCIGHVTSSKGKYPSTDTVFGPTDINIRLLRRLKHGKACKGYESLASVQNIFDDGQNGQRCLVTIEVDNPMGIAATDRWAIAAGYVPLHSRCPLFGRKFPKQSVQNTTAVMLSFKGGALGKWC